MGFEARISVFCLLGFLTKKDSNQSAQLQRLDRIVKFCIDPVSDLYRSLIQFYQ